MSNINKKPEVIQLSHGGGGQETNTLIKSLFFLAHLITLF